MLRHRLITVLTFVHGVLHRTKNFVPDYRYTQNFVDAWSVDEIVLLDVTRGVSGVQESFLAVVRRFAEKSFVPITVGGGIRSLDDVTMYMNNGADKVSVNSATAETPELINDIARRYGSQCVVHSIDSRRTSEGASEVLVNCGTNAIGKSAAAWAMEGTERGAGEILLTSIDRDGSLEGYDLEMCAEVCDAVRVPVLICGGAGAWKHFVDGIKEGGASAVCTTNIYHFSENSIRSAKTYMEKAGVLVRPAA